MADSDFEKIAMPIIRLKIEHNEEHWNFNIFIKNKTWPLLLNVLYFLCTVEKWSSRQPHKLEIAGSNPARATSEVEKWLSR